MTNSRKALMELFNEANRYFFEEPKYNTYDLWQMCKQIDKDLNILDFFKKLFVDIMQLRVVDIQGYKYLAIPNADFRKPDALLPISDQEYNLLKEFLQNENTII